MKEGWEVKTLGSCFVSINNGANIKQVKGAQGLPITRIETLSNDVFNRDRMGYADIYDSKLYAKYLLNDGDILMSHINSMKFLGRAVVYERLDDGEIIIHGMNLLRLVPISELNSRYASYYFSTKDFRNQIFSISHQSINQASFNVSALKTLSIPLPPLPEQERIVSILDAEFAKIDAVKAGAEKSLQHAKDLFQAALKKELTPKEGWETKTIGEIAENLDYKRIPVTKKDRSVGIYPYYGASGIVDYVSDYLFDEELLLVSEDGANLLARSTPIAFSVSGKIWVNNHAHILRFQNIELQRFVEYFFASLDISEYVTGAAQPKFNQKALNNIKVTYPSTIEEQGSVVARLDTLNTHCKTLQANYERTIALCDDMKQALLRKAFNGEL